MYTCVEFLTACLVAKQVLVEHPNFDANDALDFLDKKKNHPASLSGFIRCLEPRMEGQKSHGTD
jgi:hypothetical protein